MLDKKSCKGVIAELNIGNFLEKMNTFKILTQLTRSLHILPRQIDAYVFTKARC